MDAIRSNSQRRLALKGLGALAAGALSAPARSDTYPNKPVRVVLAYPPGGPTDSIGRLIFPKLGDAIGQPIVLENRPGAGGNIASVQVAKAPADGYTLLYASSSISISPALYRRDDWAPSKLFVPIVYTVNVPQALLVNPSVPAHDPKELVALMRAQPGKLLQGSSGNGTLDHLIGALMKKNLGVSFQHVPYNGNSAVIPDLMSGRIDFMFAGAINAALPLIKEGRLRAIGVTTAQRVSVLPDAPSLGETILPGFDAGTWQGLVGPIGTPAATIRLLNAELNKIIADPAVKAQILAQGSQTTGSTPEKFGEFIESEYSRWGEVIRDVGVSAA